MTCLQTFLISTFCVCVCVRADGIQNFFEGVVPLQNFFEGVVRVTVVFLWVFFRVSITAVGFLERVTKEFCELITYPIS